VEPEPLVSAKLAAGADLVCFSGDKLLGGPQAGIILGKRALVDRLRAHSLFRALRVDKLTLVALEATLSAYLDPAGCMESIPTLRAILEPAESVRLRAKALRDSLQAEVPRLRVRVIPSAAQAGSGSLPARDIPSFAVALVHPEREAEDLAAALRRSEPPIFARIREEEVLLDLRTLLDGEDVLVLAALRVLCP
jgi:L-seryl-tRNA(Ser) seleniumtransferase